MGQSSLLILMPQDSHIFHRGRVIAIEGVKGIGCADYTA
jgi:hypothetical protein